MYGRQCSGNMDDVSSVLWSPDFFCHMVVRMGRRDSLFFKTIITQVVVWTLQTFVSGTLQIFDSTCFTCDSFVTDSKPPLASLTYGAGD